MFNFVYSFFQITGSSVSLTSWVDTELNVASMKSLSNPWYLYSIVSLKLIDFDLKIRISSSKSPSSFMLLAFYPLFPLFRIFWYFLILILHKNALWKTFKITLRIWLLVMTLEIKRYVSDKQDSLCVTECDNRWKNYFVGISECWWVPSHQSCIINWPVRVKSFTE